MIKISKFWSMGDQRINHGNGVYSVPSLIEHSKDLPVMDIPIVHLSLGYTYDNVTLREMVQHMLHVQEADLDYPIILDEDGGILDGRHRLMKSLLEGKDTIKAVRFTKNPPLTGS